MNLNDVYTIFGEGMLHIAIEAIQRRSKESFLESRGCFVLIHDLSYEQVLHPSCFQPFLKSLNLNADTAAGASTPTAFVKD